MDRQPTSTHDRLVPAARADAAEPPAEHRACPAVAAGPIELRTAPVSGDRARVVVLGTGYVGLTAAACFAALGHDVVGLDTDEDKVARLGAGVVDIVEEGLAELVTDGLAAGRLRFLPVSMSDGALVESPNETGPARLQRGPGWDAIAAASVVLLCLPTPTRPDGALDLGAVEAASRRIGPALAPGAVVVTKSTVPVGAHAELARWLGRDDVAVVSNPEFLREGTAVRDFMQPDRVVVGGDDPAAVERVAALYDTLDAPILTMDAASAELVKVGANAFLAARLSLVNELARLCERVGADIADVTAGMGSDHRIGAAFLRPGPGWGGSCFPKDTRCLAHLAESVGVSVPVVEATVSSNEHQFDHVVATVADAVGGALAGRRVAVWGLTFKAGTDDCRDSPAIRIVEDLVRSGAEVAVVDPAARTAPEGTRRFADPLSASEGCDVVVVATEWPEFARVDLADVASTMAGRAVVDTRDVVDPAAAERAGLVLVRTGRPRPVTVIEPAERRVLVDVG